MSETKKTAGQVLEDAIYKSLFGDGKPTPDGTLSPVRGTSAAGRKAYADAANAVIAWHEAQQWRPMSEYVLGKEVLFSWECSGQAGVICGRIVRDQVQQKCRDGEWSRPYEGSIWRHYCLGWWPLPEVPR